MAKPGRNDACHCGSGAKYKKCCLAKDEAAEREGMAEAQREARREDRAAERRLQVQELKAAMAAKLAGAEDLHDDEGLTRLGVLHHTTLPYSPYQNAKQEAFWGPVEGRLVAMLEHVPDLTIGTTPLARLLEGPARRPAPTMPTISKKTTNPQPVPSLCRAKWASRRSRPPLEARSLS
jgi:hypothetical protein